MINNTSKFTLRILPTIPGNSTITFHSCQYISGGLRAFATKGAALRYIHAHMFWDIESRGGTKWTTKTSKRLPFNQVACEEVLTLLRSSYMPEDDPRFQQFVKNFTYLNDKKNKKTTKKTTKPTISRPKLITPDSSPVITELTETVQKQQDTINKLTDEMKLLKEMVLSMKDEMAEKEYVTVDLVVPEPLPEPEQVEEEEPEEDEEPDEPEEDEEPDEVPEKEEERYHEDDMTNVLMKLQMKLDNPEDSEEEEEDEETPVKQHDLSTDLGRHDAAQEERINVWRERNKKREEADAKRREAYKNTEKGRSWENLKNGFSS